MLEPPHLILAARATDSHTAAVLAGMKATASLALHVAGANVFAPAAGTLGPDPARWFDEAAAAGGDLFAHHGWVPTPGEIVTVEAMLVYTLAQRLTCRLAPSAGGPTLVLECTGPRSAILRHLAYTLVRAGEALGLAVPADLRWTMLLTADRIGDAWAELRAMGEDDLTRSAGTVRAHHFVH